MQRENPELQRRAQQVINACVSMGTQSPILSIHDVGAGGLSNAVPEIVHDRFVFPIRLTKLDIKVEN